MAEVRVSDIFVDDGFTPSELSPDDGPGQAFIKLLGAAEFSDGGVRMGFWRAEPGDYVHPGGPGEETFVVVEGEATLSADGDADCELRPGVVVTIPANRPSRMAVRKALRKFAVVVDQRK
jgi:uncharacterized cupin superfamily protein